MFDWVLNTPLLSEKRKSSRKSISPQTLKFVQILEIVILTQVYQNLFPLKNNILKIH